MRLRLAALFSIFACAMIFGGFAPALAATDGIDVNGTLTDSRTDPPAPVSGVKINVDLEGSPVGSVVTGADGKFSIPLPGDPIDLLGKTVTVQLDTSTFPKDTSLTDSNKDSYDIVIKTNFDIPVNYRIGPERDVAPPMWEQIIQRLLNGLTLGLLLALGAIGLSLIFGTTGLTNFAHGELITLGSLIAFSLNNTLGWPFALAAIAALVLSAIFGFANDRLLWKPLRNRGTGLLAMMIVSIGLSIFLRNVFQYFWGADKHQYDGVPTPPPWSLGPIDVRPKDIYVSLICIVILVVVSLAVQRTRLGKATRAVADNPPLAASSGIDVDRVITTVWVVGAALAGIGGVLWGVIYGFDFQVGLKILLLVFAAVTLGGLGNIWGAMVGSLVVGVLIEMSSLVIPSELKYVTALVMLIVVLLVRPQGLLGRAERIG